LTRRTWAESPLDSINPQPALARTFMTDDSWRLCLWTRLITLVTDVWEGIVLNDEATSGTVIEVPWLPTASGIS
jgi:hypothetical protein